MAKAVILDIPRPDWAEDERYICAVKLGNVTWAWTESDYETGLRSVVSFRVAQSSKGERQILHWWSFETYTAEHFRRFVALGFPTHSQSNNWTAKQIDEAWEQHTRPLIDTKTLIAFWASFIFCFLAVSI